MTSGGIRNWQEVIDMPEAITWQQMAKNPATWKDIAWDNPQITEFTTVVEERYELPPGALQALKFAEHTPAPSSGRRTVSPKGAQGLMQFMPTTRRLKGGKFDHDTSNPFASVDAAGKFFQVLIDQNEGNVLAAIADYNGGPRQAKRVKAGKVPVAAETRGYLARVKSFMSTYTPKPKPTPTPPLPKPAVDTAALEKKVGGPVPK
jgi:hypothetical protein